MLVFASAVLTSLPAVAHSPRRSPLLLVPPISATVITIVSARITGITGAVRGAIRFAGVLPLSASFRLE